MFQACIDASGMGDPDILVMAGYIAPAEKWALFSKEWQERLGMRPPLDYFKMKEMTSPERLERTSIFYRVIEEYVTAGISFVIRKPDLVKVINEAEWPPEVKDINDLKNPYFFAFAAITVNLARHAKELKMTEPVDFIFDNDQEKARTIPNWERLKLTGPPEIRKLMGDTPIYRDDKTFMPLQAADLWAWWVRKWEVEGDVDGIKELKFPRKPNRNLRRLHLTASEDDIRTQVKEWLSPEGRARARMSDTDLRRTIDGIKMTLPDPSSPTRYR